MISFFDKVDKLKIAERHSKKVFALEDVQARSLIKAYQKARIQLIEKLRTTIYGTFTEAQLKVTLVQIEQALLDLKRYSILEVNEGSNSLSEQGITDLLKEIYLFEKEFTGVTQDIPLSSVIASMAPKNYLINKYESSLNSYNESIRARIQEEITQGLIQRKGLSRIIGDINQTMGQEEWRIARIARTELHGIYNISKMSGMTDLAQSLLPDLKKALIHPMDTRTGKDSKILAKINPIVPIGQPFKYTFRSGNQNITRKFMAPPDRPNDRAILVPYRKDYEK